MVSLSNLIEKDIVNITTGRNIGRADDLEFDEKTSKILNLVIYGRPKFFGLFGRDKDIKISWSEIVTIGRDVVLINNPIINTTIKNRKNKIEYD